MFYLFIYFFQVCGGADVAGSAEALKNFDGAVLDERGTDPNEEAS